MTIGLRTSDVQPRQGLMQRIARRIQTQLLPHAPSVPGLELTCYMRPADEVGGDYYDVFAMPDGRVGFCIADAT